MLLAELLSKDESSKCFSRCENAIPVLFFFFKSYLRKIISFKLFGIFLARISEKIDQ